MLETLKTYFGYDQFRPLQEEIIDSVMKKQDTVVLMPTGGGKSLCYQLPALLLPGITVVISPLIALMKDQVDGLVANGIAAGFLNSTLTLEASNTILQKVRHGEIKILYVSPERLAQTGFRQFLTQIQIDLFAVDEAHCISDWGHDFRPEYRNLRVLRQQFSQVPIIALTATATEKVKHDIIQELSLIQPNVFLSSFDRKNLHYSVVPKQNAFEKLVQLLEKHRGQSTIIYCFSRKDTEELAQQLKKFAFKSLAYHAGLEPDLRKQTQERFLRDDIDIIVATIAFGMGIDKPNVRLVVHYHMPKSVEGYYQETGRAGRDGLKSDCVLFYSPSDVRKHTFFLEQIRSEDEKINGYKKLNQMIEFCEHIDCRRKTLIEYFGEQWNQDKCSACDNCMVEKEQFDGTVITQKILSAILKMDEHYGVQHVSKVLVGKLEKKIQEKGHHHLSVFGIVKDFSLSQIQTLVSQLLQKRLLDKNLEHGTLAVTNKGKIFLKEKQRIDLLRIKINSDSRFSEFAEYDQALFERLRRLRLKIAKEMGVAPFIVFGDVTVREMARVIPQNPEAFLSLPGVGEKKLQRFGESFLSEIYQYTLETSSHTIHQTIA